MAAIILYFGSNVDAMIATKTLKDCGVAAKMIPKPSHLTSSAHLCLSIDGTFESNAVAALGRANVVLRGVVK